MGFCIVSSAELFYFNYILISMVVHRFVCVLMAHHL